VSSPRRQLFPNGKPRQSRGAPRRGPGSSIFCPQMLRDAGSLSMPLVRRLLDTRLTSTIKKCNDDRTARMAAAPAIRLARVTRASRDLTGLIEFDAGYSCVVAYDASIVLISSPISAALGAPTRERPLGQRSNSQPVRAPQR